jgi:hypothetical protein
MADLDVLKAEIKRISFQAVQAKMNLHDLAEDLPLNWELIPATAARAYEIYRDLETKRAVMKEMGA